MSTATPTTRDRAVLVVLPHSKRDRYMTAKSAAQISGLSNIQPTINRLVRLGWVTERNGAYPGCAIKRYKTTAAGLRALIWG